MRSRSVLLVALVVVAGVLGLEPTPAPAADARPLSGVALGAQYHGLWSEWSDADRTRVLDHLVRAGAGWIRVDVGWVTLEEDGPRQVNRWYLSRLEASVEAARARGLEVLVTLWGTPRWANGGRSRAVPPDDPRHYARVAGRLARRFEGRVAAWEVWNEPNERHFFRGSAPTCVPLLRRAARAVRRADPSATVVLGGTSYNDTGWLADVYAAGARGSFDALATHPYLSPSDDPPERPDDGTIWTLDHVRAVRRLMDAQGDESLPIWFTELGWSSHANPPGTEPWERGVSERRQAAYLERALRLIPERYPTVSHVFWYSARDRDDSVHAGGYGLLTTDLQPKPALRALRRVLRGSRSR